MHLNIKMLLYIITCWVSDCNLLLCIYYLTSKFNLCSVNFVKIYI